MSARPKYRPAFWSDDAPYPPAALVRAVSPNANPWPARDAELAFYWLHTRLSGPGIAERMGLTRGVRPAVRARGLGLPLRPAPLMRPVCFDTLAGFAVRADARTLLERAAAERRLSRPAEMRLRRRLPVVDAAGMPSVAGLVDRSLTAEARAPRAAWLTVKQWAVANRVDVAGCDSRADELARVNAARRAAALPPFTCMEARP